MAKKEAADGLWRRQFLGGAGALALGGSARYETAGSTAGQCSGKHSGIWLW